MSYIRFRGIKAAYSLGFYFSSKSVKFSSPRCSIIHKEDHKVQSI